MSRLPQIGVKIEFSRPLATSRLVRDGHHNFDETATAEECAELAKLYDAQSVESFRFSGKIAREGDDGLRLRGNLRATVIQTCVVTLGPVKTKIDESVERVYSPDVDPEEIDLDSAEEDALEPMTRTLNIGLVATEAAALALPPYPKAKGVGAGDLITDSAADDPEKEKPFAALAALRDKLAQKE